MNLTAGQRYARFYLALAVVVFTTWVGVTFVAPALINQGWAGFLVLLALLFCVPFVLWKLASYISRVLTGQLKSSDPNPNPNQESKQ